MFSGPQVERHARPPPVIDEEFQGDVGFSGGEGRNAGFLGISSDLLTIHPTGTILGADRVGEGVATDERLQGMEDFDFLIAYGIGIEGNRRLHCYEGEQLEHMVLDHIPNGSRFLIIRTATLKTNIFGDRDLDVINIASIPDRLKDPVCQAEDEDILHGLFAEVVVNTVDLVLFKDLADLPVEFLGGGEIVSEGLFDDNPRPSPSAVSVQTGGTKVLNDFRILARWCGQVENAIAGRATFLIDAIEQAGKLFVPGRIVKIGLEIVDSGSETLPYLWVNGFLSRVFVDGIERLLAKFVISIGPSGETYNGEASR